MAALHTITRQDVKTKLCGSFQAASSKMYFISGPSPTPCSVSEFLEWGSSAFPHDVLLTPPVRGNTATMSETLHTTTQRLYDRTDPVLCEYRDSHEVGEEVSE